MDGIDVTPYACSWRLVEAAQGIPNALPNDKSVLNGENEATWLAQQAKAQGFTVMRLFGIADVNWDEGAALQPSPGACTGTCFQQRAWHAGHGCQAG